MQLESSARKNKNKLLEKDDVLFIRTKFWARMVVFRAGFIDNPKKMQRLFSPDKYVNGQSPPKDWEGYYKGLIKQPLRRTIDKTNDLMPNSEKIFDMPLWEIFYSDIATDKQVEKLVFHIKDIRIFNRIIKKETDSSIFHLRTRNLSKTIEYLVSLSTFDALNALTILLLNLEIRINTNIHNRLEYKGAIMSSILKVLIIMSVQYPIKKCFTELFTLYKRRFSYSWFQGNPKLLLYIDYKWKMDEVDFINSSKDLFYIVESAKILNVINDKTVVTFLCKFIKSNNKIKDQIIYNLYKRNDYKKVSSLFNNLLSQ